MSDSRAALTETLRTIHAIVDEAGLRREDVLDVAALSFETGIPEETVTALLNGESVEEVELGERVSQRFRFLRETRPRPGDGKEFSLPEIAASFGASRQSLTPLAKGTGKPGLQHAFSIEKFFGVPTGFLTTEAVPALDRALQSVLKDLRELHPLTALMASHDVKEIALRSGKLKGLSDDSRRLLWETLDALFERDSKGQ
ncbi:XRE family transcriptional regulator [Streptomyces sp. NPDC006475]|uniref:XRE family transcriptional regulator n=1 Tax=Streptomyces sp. NPDC006475 TaxID=3155719 RepID=UPI0033B94476